MVKIGYIATLSGQQAQLGIDSVDGFKLALQKLNGKLGGVPVELVVVDDQLKPEIGIEQAKRLVEKEQTPIIVGTTFSNILMAIAQPTTRAQVFLISPNAGPSPLAGPQCNPNFFAVAFQNDQIYEPIGAFLQKKGTKRMVALAPNYQAGKDAIAGFKHTFKGELLDEIYTPLAQLDFSAELARISSLKPDAVFAFYPGGLAVAFVKQYDQAGLTKTVPLYGGFPLVTRPCARLRARRRSVWSRRATGRSIFPSRSTRSSPRASRRPMGARPASSRPMPTTPHSSSTARSRPPAATSPTRTCSARRCGRPRSTPYAGPSASATTISRCRIGISGPWSTMDQVPGFAPTRRSTTAWPIVSPANVQ